LIKWIYQYGKGELAVNNQLTRIIQKQEAKLAFANACALLINETEIPVFTTSIVRDWHQFKGFIFGQAYYFSEAIRVPTVLVENPETEPFQQMHYLWGVFKGFYEPKGEDHAYMFFSRDKRYFAFKFREELLH
jgi:hypothetical protein